MEEAKLLALQMHLAGLSRREAAEKLGLCYSTFNRKLRTGGLNEREEAEIRKWLREAER